MSLTKEKNKQFEVIANILINNGDLDKLLDFIPDKIKKEFIDNWNAEIKEAEVNDYGFRKKI